MSGIPVALPELKLVQEGLSSRANVACCLYCSKSWDEAKHWHPFRTELETFQERWPGYGLHVVAAPDFPLPPLPPWVFVWRPQTELPHYLQHLYRYAVPVTDDEAWWFFRGTDTLTRGLESMGGLLGIADLLDLPLIVQPDWCGRGAHAFPVNGGFSARGEALRVLRQFLATAMVSEHEARTFRIDEELLRRWSIAKPVPRLIALSEPVVHFDALAQIRDLLAYGPRCVIVQGHRGWPGCPLWLRAPFGS